MARYDPSEVYVPIQFDARLRDEVVQQLSDELAGASGQFMSVQDWVGVRQVVGLALAGSTFYVQRKRRSTADATYPGPGDVLFYMVRGEAIRHFIRDRILEATPPVVLLAHSLGGIASVDLLAQEALPQVKLLVTVGSQASFLYEIDSLPSCRFGEPLPDNFPEKWLNIYDLRDFLSFVGEKIFPGRVEDVKVDNRQPFPRSHSAYWTNPQTWKAILDRIP
jgi:hypothetical protein